MDKQILSDVLKAWGLTFKTTRPELAVAGSPERTEYRVVVEDDGSSFYLLESVAPALVSHKENIINALAHLHRCDIPFIQAYLPYQQNEYILNLYGRSWQLVPYFKGVVLDRPAYTREGWRGKILAEFLVEMKQKTGPIPGFNASLPFSLIQFIHGFQEKLRKFAPQILERLQPALILLGSGFMETHDCIPVSFCHGDYHPLNVIWSEKSMKAVIDWEFLGYKAELYDIANMIGCLGMEDPACLTGDMVYEFIKGAIVSGLWHKKSWDWLFEFVLALRFAWLSEWLRKPDPEMIELEMVYIELLLENRAKIESAWELKSGSA